jgi:hypothetical protein
MLWLVIILASGAAPCDIRSRKPFISEEEGERV